ncbi:calcium-binding EF-hand domain-containing protein [Dictyostelium discoideum AX4]|uniref:Calcium-binding EF-hand domain-containing protein n=1 Tax=Dictyostelium discoideum TaxID=44689 RepID=Q1ZXH5_DICDI|nr:calcium-binding EF-hand domain-containing protein [Dictyostelium discoideum AX4]EAS66883.1 calcium-binding EF-hand domain-containing protein [Dictyostelium discoideum AX4]|eukprot:XP_001134567.1 calcium-binding EF-hand domain-containing protein [Dictyostelium discoideum AX4]
MNFFKKLCRILNEIIRTDSDFNQSITLQELIADLKNKKAKNPVGTAVAVFRDADKNKNGKLTYEEIRNWAITKNSNAINDALTKEVNEILSPMDKDNDGNLTAGEMLDYFVKQGLKLNDACEMIKSYFEQVDKDSDGILTVCELKKFIGADLQVPSQ